MRFPAVILLLCLAATAAIAGPRERVAGSNAELCDTERNVCLRGSITYYSNPRLLELRSRVQHATGPGLIVFRLTGETRDGHVRRTSIEVRIRGRYSEIVSTKLITDHPDVDSWTLESIQFTPGPPPDSNNR